mmetsp:Transcript_105713/g.329482  ORF Transcript_105713/g.329482 Transcript_105713/m.329482 type:complete len:130 (-) Transcript_105713:167-556(-)
MTSSWVRRRTSTSTCRVSSWPRRTLGTWRRAPAAVPRGADKCRIVWSSTDAFVCSLGPPEVPEDQRQGEEGPVVIAGARFYSVMGMAFAPEEAPRHSIDDVIFKSSWSAEQGVAQWKIAYIGGPVAPVE